VKVNFVNSSVSKQSTNNQSDNPHYKPYLASAYKGIQKDEYRNTAQKEQRQGQSMLARDQCGRSVLPRGSITGMCLNCNSDVLPSLKREGLVRKWAHITDDVHLRYPAPSSSNTTVWEGIQMFWGFCILTSFICVPGLLAVSIVMGIIDHGMIGVWSGFVEMLPLLVYWVIGLLLSKGLYHFICLFKQKDTYNFVIFNRSTGNIEFPSPDRQSLLYYPFAEFNAHHRTVHTQNGLPQYGLTLLHYKEQIMYQVILSDIKETIVHWEQLQNFMDVTQPLADIPRFEQFRQSDKLTAEFDRKNNRPINFWYRVEQTFLKKVVKEGNKVMNAFPEGCLHYEQALKKGYSVPDIITTPWKYFDNELSQEFNQYKELWYWRYLIGPVMIGG